MRYDEDLETLELSVRELAFAELDWGGAGLPFARLRAELGRAVHARYQRELPPGHSEVPLRLEREIEGVRCLIRGRADVVRREAGGCVVEEIKSVFDSDDEAERPGASFQVQLYALALAEEGELSVRPRIVLVELEGGRQRTIEVDFDRAQVERRLDEALRRQLVLARAQAERERARREAAAAIRFPFTPRPGQQELIEAVAEGLAGERPVMLSAPTGTGKTVVAMVPALREALRRGASLWVLTAKTTQRQLAAETFAAIVAASDAEASALRAVVTRRKQGMCPPGHLRCHPALCPLLAEFRERCGPLVAELRGETVVRPEQLFERGRAATLCPYELMHALIADADVVVADYSHVYDPRRSRAFEGRRLVVVDEAHNLVDRAREQASAFVPRGLPALAGTQLLAGPLARLRREVDEAIDDALAQAAEEERPAHEGRATAELDRGRWRALGLEAGVLALHYAHQHHEDMAASAARSPAHAGARDLEDEALEIRDPVLETLEELAYLGELCDDSDPALATYLASPEAQAGAGVGVLCLDPARRLARHHRWLEGVVMMSATLEPLDYFADVLGLARLDPELIAAPSPFWPEHRLVCVVPTLRTTFDERDEHAPAVAGHIAEVLAARPGNYAAFFPSFRYLTTVSRHLDARALGCELITQLPGMSEAMRARVLDQLRRGDRPTLLLAVTGGVFAEGVDLPGEALIGAIIVGPALPAASFERRLMQAYYQERHEAGFAYAMAFPAMQRVIQAAGRVHRTPEDRGVIVLLGARFCEPPYCEALPGHWIERGGEELVTHDLPGRLREFWDE